MRNMEYPAELNYELINRAVHGDEAAIEKILQIYEPYHDYLATRTVACADGTVTLEMAYLNARLLAKPVASWLSEIVM